MYPLIVIGSPAGCTQALTRLIAQLPRTLPAAVLVVQHLASVISGQQLVDRLRAQQTLPCHLACHGTLIEPGNVYVAPPNRHLQVKEKYLLVTKGPLENSYRPAADTLFRSAAIRSGSNVIGVMLTGMLYDGANGLEFIKQAGGIVVLQDPNEAEFPISVPERPLHHGPADYTISLAEMGSLLTQLALLPARAERAVSEKLAV